MYKGYVQLAIRSGQYSKLNVLEIKEGELVKFDPLTEEITVNLIDDFEAREKAPTVGFYAMFEYLNGFRKAIYWSREKMMSHADKYSMAFSKDAYEKLIAGEIPDKEMWKYSSYWYSDFDGMAKKTLLRQLISKWGVMSTDMQKALETDQTVSEMGSDGIINTSDFDNVDYSVAPEGTTEKVQTEAESTEIIQQASLEDF